jgi:hypothetical protein
LLGDQLCARDGSDLYTDETHGLARNVAADIMEHDVAGIKQGAHDRYSAALTGLIYMKGRQ